MLKQAVGALVLSPAYKGVEEIRLRVNRPVRILREGKYIFRYGGRTEKQSANVVICHREELDRCLELMSDYSLYAFNEELKNGFITLPGGHRVGICGQAVCDKGEVKHIKI